MAVQRDRQFYKQDPVTGEMVFDYVVRPSIHNNNLHPIPTGANIKIKIEKNDELVVLFNYDVTRAVPRGKQLGAYAVWQLSESSTASLSARPMGEVIQCLDVPIMQKKDGEYVLDHIQRPRNVRRTGLAGLTVGDHVHIEFLGNDRVMDWFDYTVETPPSEGCLLFGMGSVDFVQMSTGA